MFGAIGTALSGFSLISKIKGWFGGGSDDGNDSTILDYEKNASRAMRNSWKDEFIIIILWTPIIMMILGAIWEVAVGRSTLYDAGTGIVELLNAALTTGLYGTLLVITVVASFGLHINRVNKKFAAVREAAKNGGIRKNPKGVKRVPQRKPASRTAAKKTATRKKAVPKAHDR